MERYKRGSSSNYQRVKKFRFVHKDADSSLSSDSDSDSEHDDSKTELNTNKVTKSTGAVLPQITLPPNKSSSSDECSEESVSSHAMDFADESSDSDTDSYYSYDSSSCSSRFSSDDDEEVVETDCLLCPVTNLKENLKRWAIRNNITLKALSELLVLLVTWLKRFSIILNWLHIFPKDARTLLGTNKKIYNVRPMECQSGKLGEFVYFSLSTVLQECVNQKYFPDSIITLCFNIDGLPLFKSSAVSFWPIMCIIYDEEYEWKPFPVAIFCGPGKPASIGDYLQEFVLEITTLINTGITIHNSYYDVRVKCYICDTPARSFVKCTTGHGGFFCCERCEVKGETVNKKRVYSGDNYRQRTFESFLSKSQPDHHTGTCPLMEVPDFNPMDMFILDYMHLLCLGVMKHLLVFYWVAPPKKVPGVSLSARSIKSLSDLLESLKRFTPADFPRKSRGLTDVKRFKATEFRYILLYSGPIILKDALPKSLYKHFLILHTASRILCSRNLCISLAQYAKALYHHFFNLLPKYYGPDSQIMNMHNLVHIADDVINHQCNLDMISGFPFENELGKMKKKLRTSNAPLAQYCKRLTESTVTPLPKVRMTLKPIIKKTQGKIVTKVQYLNTVLSIYKPDNYVLLKNEVVVEIVKITFGMEKQVVICVKRWCRKQSIFKFPCQSSKLQEWILDEQSNIEECWNIEDIQAKLFHCIVGGKDYAIGILHSNV